MSNKALTPEQQIEAWVLMEKYCIQSHHLQPLILAEYRLDGGLHVDHPDYKEIVHDKSDDFKELFKACDGLVMEIMKKYSSFLPSIIIFEDHSKLITDTPEIFDTWKSILQFGAEKFKKMDFWRDQLRKKIILADVLITNTYNLDFILPKTEVCERFMYERYHDIIYCIKESDEIIKNHIVGGMFQEIETNLLEEYCNVRDRFNRVQYDVYEHWTPIAVEKNDSDYFEEEVTGLQNIIKRRAIGLCIDAIRKELLLRRLIQLTSNFDAHSVAQLKRNVWLDFAKSVQKFEQKFADLAIFPFYDPEKDCIKKVKDRLFKHVSQLRSDIGLTRQDYWPRYMG